MDLFWTLLLGVVFSLMAGFSIFIIAMVIINGVKDFIKEKRKIPKDPKKVSEYIRSKKDFFRFAENNLKLNLEEEKENERRAREKFREFEKLRRIATTQESINGKRTGTSRFSGNAELQNRGIQMVYSSSDTSGVKRKLKLDD